LYFNKGKVKKMVMRTWIFLFILLMFGYVAFAQQLPALILPVGHTSEINSAQFSPDGKYIVSASGDKTAKIWEVSSGNLLYDLKGHTDYVRLAEFSPDGRYIVTASASNDETKIWEVSSGKLLQDLKGYTNQGTSAEFSPNGKIIVSERDFTDAIFEVSPQVTSAEFSPDGKYIVSARDNTAKIWEVSSGKLLFDLKGHTSEISSAEISPDGKYIVSASGDNTAKIWEVSSGKLLQDLKWYTDWVGLAKFSPDGKYIMSAGDTTAKIWEVSTGNLLHVIKGHTSWLTSAQFSPDGTSILTTSLDNKTMLWDVATGKMRYTRLQLSNNDWLVYDEDYRYDGSPGARDYLYFVCGLEIVDMPQMKDALYVPDLAEKIMSGAEINYPRLSELDLCKSSK